MEVILIKTLQFFASLSLLVIIHEFGHYITARMFKIRVEKFYLFFYVRYTRSQERQTPEFQLIKPLLDKLPVNNPIRQQFRKESLPLMPLCNILTFDTRVGVLFFSLFIGHPWIYIIFDITVLQILRFYTRHRHEALCHKLHQKLSTV